MIGLVVKKELMEHVLSLRFIVATILTVGLVIICIVILIGDYTQKKVQFDANRQYYQDEAERMDDFRSLQKDGMIVERPPEPLQVGYYGVAKSDDRAARIQTFYEPQTLGTVAKNPVLPLFPTPDILYVVACVLSLMAFVFSYDAISGERESGTLKLMMSYSLPRDIVLLGKWFGGYLSLVVPFVIALAMAAIVISVSAQIDFGPGEWGAYVIAALTSLLFLAVMFSLGMFVSASCARSSTSIMVLIFVWVCLALMIPNMSPYVANIFSPVTPYDTVESSIREGIANARDEFNDATREYRHAMYEAYRKGGPELELARQQYREQAERLGEIMKERSTDITEQYSRAFQRELVNQISVTKLISRLSPISSYVYIVTDLAGTGVHQQLQFRQALRNYQWIFREYLDEKTGGLRSGGGPGRGRGGPRGRRTFMGGREGPEFDLSDIPLFDYASYVSDPLAGKINRCLVDFCLLAVAGILLFMLAYVKFLRADVIE